MLREVRPEKQKNNQTGRRPPQSTEGVVRHAKNARRSTRDETNTSLRKYRQIQSEIRRRLIWRFIVTFSLLAVIAICVWLLPWFRIQRYVVEGNTFHSTADIVERAGVPTDTHLINALSGSFKQIISGRSVDAEERLYELLPEAESISCVVSFPSTLRIEIEERTPQYRYMGESGWTMIDSAGKVIITGVADPPSGVPEYRGDIDAVRGKKEGEQLPSARAELARKTALLRSDLRRQDEESKDGWTLADDLASVSLENGQVLFNLDLSGEPRMTDSMVEEHGRILFKLDPEDEDAEEALLWVRNVVRGGALTGLGDGRIDLSGKQKVFVPDP